MKLSDYLADFLVNQGVKHTFVITGGSIVHAIDSVARNPNIEYICTQHEQAAAMAADAYSRVTGNLGVAMATSGPGATNLMTGVCCSYFDSIPTIYITGQVPRSQLRKKYGVRQLGFQETDVVNMFKGVTKYAKLVEEPKDIKYHLQKAVYLAKSGRPGPVLLDIPDDVQWANIDPNDLIGFNPKKPKTDFNDLENKIDKAIDLLKESERPVIILGGGVRSSNSEYIANEVVQKLNLPVALTWGAMDILPHDYPMSIRDFGVAANRAGNFIVQNSDLILAIGTRLDTHETGANHSTFARSAKKIIVDIDKTELNKYERLGLNVDYLINHKVDDFLNIFNKKIDKVKTKNISSWIKKIAEWKEKYPICLEEYKNKKDNVDPYVFMNVLSKESGEGNIIITDAGSNLTWTMQGFKVKKDQRLFSAFNHSPMGYSLPASIGASFATNKPVTCIIGDGGIQMNIQELATIKYHNLPIKIFLLNNNGYGIVQQSQDTWFNSKYIASNPESGVAVPNFIGISKAYDIKTMEISNHSKLGLVKKVLDYKGPILCDVKVEQHQKIMPKLEFGRSIEDSYPYLKREEFLENMLVKPLKQ